MRLSDMVKVAAMFAKDGDPRRDFKLAAIGVRRDGVVVISRNEISYSATPSCHAEARLVKKLGMHADMVLVVRVLANGDLAMAKPCSNCEAALKNKKVKTVYYTNYLGKIEKMR